MSCDDNIRPVGGEDNVTRVPGAETIDGTPSGSGHVMKAPADGTLLSATAPDDDVLTVEQAARLLQVSPKTVRKLFRRKQLPGGRRLGAKVIRFSKVAVLEWLRGNASVSRRSR